MRQCPSEKRRTEHRQFLQPRIRSPVPCHEEPAQHRTACGPDQTHARLARAGAALDRTVPQRGVCVEPRLGHQLQTDGPLLSDLQVYGRETRGARAPAGGVECSPTLAAIRGAAADRCRHDSGRAHLLSRAAVMAAYLIRRLLYGFLTVLGVLLLLFVLFFAVTDPDDIARKAVGERARPEVYAQWQKNHGYDRPLFLNPAFAGSGRFTDTLLAEHYRRMLTFDFGRSDADDSPISRRLREGALPSLGITVPLFVMGLVVSVAVALFVAFFRETYIDRV